MANNTDEKTELGKCPFCMSNNTEVRHASPLISTGGEWLAYIVCVCGARSGYFSYDEGAVETWNTASEAVDRLRD